MLLLVLVGCWLSAVGRLWELALVGRWGGRYCYKVAKVLRVSKVSKVSAGLARGGEAIGGRAMGQRYYLVIGQRYYLVIGQRYYLVIGQRYWLAWPRATLETLVTLETLGTLYQARRP